MTVNTNIEWTHKSDAAIIDHIGQYIKQLRSGQRKTQAQLAERAGVHRWTIQQIERGESITLSSLIQILRALDVLNVFKPFELSDQISPLDYAKLKKKPQERVRAKKMDTPQKDDLTW